jgi:hypothetical protein
LLVVDLEKENMQVISNLKYGATLENVGMNIMTKTWKSEIHMIQLLEMRLKIGRTKAPLLNSTVCRYFEWNAFAH